MYASALQRALVKATLPRLTRRPAQCAMAFRMNLSRYAPALVSGLRVSPVPLLAGAVAVASCPQALRHHVSPLAQELRAAGMSPRGYIALHAALMDMATEHLGPDAELEEAYSDVIGTILATMLNEAHGPRSHVMPLAA